MFSVVIPLYNKAPYIGAAIESVLGQDFDRFELLVIDDGSSDNGPDIVRGFQCDDRVRLISKANGGQSSARNLGIESSRYDLIAFLDADDYWLSSFLSTIHLLTQDFPDAGLYATGYLFARPDREELEEPGVSLSEDFRGYFSYFLEASRGTTPVTSSSVVIRREVVDRAGLFDTRFRSGQDLEYWCRVQLHARLAYDGRPRAIYNLSVPGSIMTTLSATRRGGNPEGLFISPSTDLVYRSLSTGQVPTPLINDAALYIESRKWNAAKARLVQGRRHEARELLSTLNRNRYRMAPFYLALSYLPERLLVLLFRGWSQRHRVRRLVGRIMQSYRSLLGIEKSPNDRSGK